VRCTSTSRTTFYHIRRVPSWDRKVSAHSNICMDYCLTVSCECITTKKEQQLGTHAAVLRLVLGLSSTRVRWTDAERYKDKRMDGPLVNANLPAIRVVTKNRMTHAHEHTYIQPNGYVTAELLFKQICSACELYNCTRHNGQN
jgi:hypothetical protein